MVAALNGFIDETGTHDGASVLAGCGYLFEPVQADIFKDEWEPYLLDKGLEEFHATDCFRQDDADEIFSRLTSLVLRTAQRGVVRFIQREHLDKLAANGGVQQFTGSGYTMCVLSCMERMAELATNQGKEVVYFIERGNQFDKELAHFLNEIKASDQLKKKFAMAGADIYEKKAVIQLQAADLLAWEFGRACLYGKREHRRENAITLTKGIPHHISGFSDTSAAMQGMVNWFNGLKSNRKF